MAIPVYDSKYLALCSGVSIENEKAKVLLRLGVLVLMLKFSYFIVTKKFDISGGIGILCIHGFDFVNVICMATLQVSFGPADDVALYYNEKGKLKVKVRPMCINKLVAFL